MMQLMLKLNACDYVSLTFIHFPGMRGSPLRVIRPGEEGKLRLGGGGGGDLEGFSVRYRGTVSSSGKGSNSGILRKKSYMCNMFTVILEQAMRYS